MKRLFLLPLIIAVLLFTGCPASNPTGPNPDTEIDAYGLEFYDITWLDEDQSLANDIFIQVVSVDTSFTLRVSQGQVFVQPLYRGVEYTFSFLYPNGEKIILQLDDQVDTSFTVCLKEGMKLEELNIPKVALKPVVPPTTGSLSITSSPSGATVYVNGEVKGLTPITIHNFDPGQYQVEVKKEGYNSQTQMLWVEVGETVQKSFTLAGLQNIFDGFVNEREWLFRWSNGGGGKVTIDIHDEILTITVMENGYKAQGRILNLCTGEVEFKFGDPLCHGHYDFKTRKWSGIDLNGSLTWEITAL